MGSVLVPFVVFGSGSGSGLVLRDFFPSSTATSGTHLRVPSSIKLRTPTCVTPLMPDRSSPVAASSTSTFPLHERRKGEYLFFMNLESKRNSICDDEFLLAVVKQ